MDDKKLGGGTEMKLYAVKYLRGNRTGYVIASTIAEAVKKVTVGLKGSFYTPSEQKITGVFIVAETGMSGFWEGEA